jgi:hypothetical protein
MGFLDKARQMANKENLDKMKKQAQEKVDQAKDKLGTSGKSQAEQPEAEEPNGSAE